MRNVSKFYPLPSIRKIVSRSHFILTPDVCSRVWQYVGQFLGTVSPVRGQNIGSEAQGYVRDRILRGDCSWILGNWGWIENERKKDRKGYTCT